MVQNSMQTTLQGVRRSLHSAEKKLIALNRAQLPDTAASAATKAALERVSQALEKVLEALGETLPSMAAVAVLANDERE